MNVTSYIFFSKLKQNENYLQSRVYRRYYSLISIYGNLLLLSSNVHRLLDYPDVCTYVLAFPDPLYQLPSIGNYEICSGIHQLAQCPLVKYIWNVYPNRKALLWKLEISAYNVKNYNQKGSPEILIKTFCFSFLGKFLK